MDHRREEKDTKGIFWGEAHSEVGSRGMVQGAPLFIPGFAQWPLPESRFSCCSSHTRAEAQCPSAGWQMDAGAFSCYTLLSRTRALGALTDESEFLIVEGASRILKAYRRALSKLVQMRRCKVCGKTGDEVPKGCLQPLERGEAAFPCGSPSNADAHPYSRANRLKSSEGECCPEGTPDGHIGSTEPLPSSEAFSGVRMMAEAHVSFCLSRLVVSSMTSGLYQGANSSVSGSVSVGIRNGLSRDMREAEGGPNSSFPSPARGEVEAAVPLLEGSWDGSGLSWGRRISHWPRELSSDNVNLEEMPEQQQPSCNTAISPPEERLLPLHPFSDTTDLQHLLRLFGDRERQLRDLMFRSGDPQHHSMVNPGKMEMTPSNESQQREASGLAAEAVPEDPVASSLEWLSNQPLQLPLQQSCGSVSPFGAPSGNSCELPEPAAAPACVPESSVAWGSPDLEESLAVSPRGDGGRPQSTALPRALRLLRLRLCRYSEAAAALDAPSYEEAEDGGKGVVDMALGSSLFEEEGSLVASFGALWGEPHVEGSAEENGFLDLWEQGAAKLPEETAHEIFYEKWGGPGGSLCLFQLSKFLDATRRRLLACLPPAFGGRGCKSGSQTAAEVEADLLPYSRGSSAYLSTRRALRAALQAARLERRRHRASRRLLEANHHSKYEAEAEEQVAKALDCSLLLALHGNTLACLLEFISTLTEAASEQILEVSTSERCTGFSNHTLTAASTDTVSLQLPRNIKSRQHADLNQHEHENDLCDGTRRYAFPSLDALELLALQRRCWFAASLESPKTYIVSCRRRRTFQTESLAESVLSSALGYTGASILQLKVLLPEETAACWLAGSGTGGFPRTQEEADGSSCLKLEFLYGNERLIRLRKDANSSLGGVSCSPDEASVLLYIEASSTALAVWTRDTAEHEAAAHLGVRAGKEGSGGSQAALVALFDLRGEKQLTLDILVDRGGWQQRLAEETERMAASTLPQNAQPSTRNALLDRVVNMVQQPVEELVLYVNGRRLCCVSLPPSPPVAPALQGRTKQVLLRANVGKGMTLLSPACPSFCPALVEELRKRALLSGSPKLTHSASLGSSQEDNNVGKLSLQEFASLCCEAVHRLCLRGSKERSLIGSERLARHVVRDCSSGMDETLSGALQVVSSGNIEAVESAVRLLEHHQRLWEELQAQTHSLLHPHQHHKDDDDSNDRQRSSSSGELSFSAACSSPASSSATNSTTLPDPLASPELLFSSSYSGSSRGCLSTSSGSPSLLPLRLRVSLLSTEARSSDEAARQPSQLPCFTCGDGTTAQEARRMKFLRALRGFRVRAENVYCVLGVLKLLFSNRHPFSSSKPHCLGPLASRLMSCILFFFSSASPDEGLCCCSACLRDRGRDPELVQAIFDAQGSSWLLRKTTTALFTSATPAILRVLIGRSKPQTLQLLLLAISRPRRKEEVFAATLLQVLEGTKAGRIVVMRLLRETCATSCSKVPKQKGQSGGTSGDIELLPGCQFSLEDPLVSLESLQQPSKIQDRGGYDVSLASAATTADRDSEALEQLGIRSCGLRVVGAAGSSFVCVEKSDSGASYCMGGRQRRRFGRGQGSTEGGQRLSSLRDACERLSSLEGSGFWQFLRVLLDLTEVQLKGAVDGFSPVQATCYAARHASEERCLSSEHQDAPAKTCHTNYPCKAWGPCNLWGQCRGALHPLHGAPGLTLGVLSNPRLVSLPLGAATGGEGCACMELHRPALWVPLKHRLQQLHDALLRAEGSSWAPWASPARSSWKDSPRALGKMCSSTPAGDVAAHVARHASEIWLWRLFRRLRERRSSQSNPSKRHLEGRGVSLDTMEAREGHLPAPVASTSSSGAHGSSAEGEQQNSASRGPISSERFVFGDSLLPRDLSHRLSTANTCHCLEEVLTVMLRTANNVLGFMLDKLLLEKGVPAITEVAAEYSESTGGPWDIQTAEANSNEGCHACEQQGQHVLDPASLTSAPSVPRGCTFLASGILPLLTFLSTLLKRLVSLGEEREASEGRERPGGQRVCQGLSDGALECVVGVTGLIFRLWPSVLQLALRCLVLIRHISSCASEEMERGRLHPLIEQCLGIVTVTSSLLQCLGSFPPLIAKLDLAHAYPSSGQHQAEAAAAQALKALPPLLVGGARYVAATETGHPFAALESAIRSSVLLLLDCSSRRFGGFRINELPLPCGVEDFLAATQRSCGGFRDGLQSHCTMVARGSRTGWSSGGPATPPAERCTGELCTEGDGTDVICETLLTVPSSTVKHPGSCPPILAQRTMPCVGSVELPAAATHVAHAVASAAVASGGCCPSLLRLLHGKAGPEEFGCHFAPFHPRLAEVQRAIGAAVLHLVGYETPVAAATYAGGGSESVQKDTEEAETLVRVAASLARRAAIQLLSKWQRRTAEAGPFGDEECHTPVPLSDSEDSFLAGGGSCSSSSSSSSRQKEPDLQQQVLSREAEVKGIVSRCEWILTSCPRGLAGPKSLMLFSRWSRLVVGSHRIGCGGREALCRSNSCPELGGGLCGGSRPVAWGQRMQRRRGFSQLKATTGRHTEASATPRLMMKHQARNIGEGSSRCLPYSSLSVARSLDFLKRLIRNGYRFPSSRKRPHHMWGPSGRAWGEDRRLEVLRKHTRNDFSRGVVILSSREHKSSDNHRWPWEALHQVSCRPNSPKEDAMMDSSLVCLVNFMLSGADVETTRRVLRVEQLSAVIRYVVLRSMKALLVAGLCSSGSIHGNGRSSDFGTSSRRKSQEDLISSGSVTQRLVTTDGATLDLADEADTFSSSPRLCSIRDGLPATEAANSAAFRSGRRLDTLGEVGGASRRASGRLLTQSSGADGGGLAEVAARAMEADPSEINCRDASCTTSSSDGVYTLQQIEEGRQGYRWPLLLDLLLPSADARVKWPSCKQPLAVPPSGTAKRYVGWLLLRMLHSLGVSMLGAQPAFHAALQQEKDTATESETGHRSAPFWKSQPLADAQQATLSEIVRAAFEWHLQKNLPSMASLVQLPAPGVYLVHPADFCWMDSALRFLTLHLCLGTEPLDHSESVILFLHHLLTLAHPVPLRLAPRGRLNSRLSAEAFPVPSDTEDATFSSDYRRAGSGDTAASGGAQSAPSPQSLPLRPPSSGFIQHSATHGRLLSGGSGQRSYVPLAVAITKILVRCFDARHWASDGSLTQKGFRLLDKNVVAGFTVMVYVQRRQMADSFTPPLKGIRNFSVRKCGADEIIGPLRDSRGGAGFKTFSFTGPVAGEPDGLEEAIADVHLQLQACGDGSESDETGNSLQQQVSAFHLQGFSREFSFPLTTDIKAHLWVKKGFLAYDAPSVQVSLGPEKEGEAGQLLPQKSDSSSSALPVCPSLSMGSKPRLLSVADTAGPGLENLRSPWQRAVFSLQASKEADLKTQLLLTRQYEGASQRLQQSAWRAFQAALWFLLVGPEDVSSEKATTTGRALHGNSLSRKGNNPFNRCAGRGSSEPVAPNLRVLGFQHSRSHPHGPLGQNAIAVESLNMTLCTMQRLVELQEQTIREFQRTTGIDGVNAREGTLLPYSLSFGPRRRGFEGAWSETELGRDCAAASRGLSRTSSLSDGEAVPAEGSGVEAPATQVPEKVLLIEKLIERILVILLRCVQESEVAAGLFMKILIAHYKTLPAQLETVLRTLPVKTCLYKLLTVCVMRIPGSREGGLDCGVTSSPVAPRDFWGPRRSASGDGIEGSCRFFPPLQPISMGNLLESAGSLVQRQQGYLDAGSRKQEQQEAVDALSIRRQQESGSAPPSPAGLGPQLSLVATPAQPYEGNEQYSSGVEPVLSFSAASPGPSDNLSALVGATSTEERTDGLFDSLPQSEIFLCAEPSADFQAEVHGRTLHVMRARNLGGVALCRAPLTFPALHVEPGEAADVIGFRIWSAGRFGVTVAPADCVLSNAQDIFDRNDVVGFRTSTCPPFWEDVFATNVSYQPGDYLSVKFTVDDQPNGQRCLHTELHVSGESIGSVLEVFYDQASQIEQARRMNLVFVLQDPLTVVYGGPDFTLQYVDPDVVRLSGGQSAGDSGAPAEERQDSSLQPPVQKMQLWHRRYPLFQQSLQMYQAVVLAPEQVLMGERRKVLDQLCAYLTTTASSLSIAFEAAYERYVECSYPMNAITRVERSDSLLGTPNLKPRDKLLNALPAVASSDNQSKPLDSGADIRRDNSTGLRPCSSRSQQLPSRDEREVLRQCRRGIAALAVIACDCKGKGELQEVLAVAERPKAPGVVDPEAIHPSSVDTSKADSREAPAGSPGNSGLGLPWLVGTSSLSRSAVAGLNQLECESLLIALTDLLTSAVVQGTLNQVAIAGHLVAPSRDWERVKAVAVTLGSKAIVALCLVLRTMLHLHPEGHPPLSEKAQLCIERVFCFLERFCFLTSGLQPRQIDPFSDDLQSLDERSGAPLDLLIKPFQPQEAPTQPPKPSSFRSASVPDLRVADSSGYRSGVDSSNFAKNTQSCDALSSDASCSSSKPPRDDLRLDMMARLCGLPESILSAEGLECPVVAGQAVLAAAETPKVWRWIFKVNEAWHAAVQSSLPSQTDTSSFLAANGASFSKKDKFMPSEAGEEESFEMSVGLGDDHPAAALFLLKPRQDEGYIRFRGPVDVRVFNYEGTCSLWSRRMVHRLVETPLRWAIRRDALHLVCTIAALSPGFLINRLQRGIAESIKKRQSDSTRRSSPLPEALNLIRLFRICTYFLSRETDDNLPDYQQPFRLHLNSEPTDGLLRRLDTHSVVVDPLYGWQRVLYTAAAQWTDEACVERLHRLLQTELLYHLIGSVGQVVSNMRHAKKSPKYCALAPSVYVAHWMMDAFVRHPLCPGSIRRAIVYPLSYSSLFALLINGSNLPLKLGLDAARMTHWMLAKYVPDAPSAYEAFSASEVSAASSFGLGFSSEWYSNARASPKSIDRLRGTPSKPWQSNRRAWAQVSGMHVKGPNRHFLGFLQCYFDCLCLVSASVFDNLEKANNWRASTLDCFSGADLNRIHVRYRINCSLLAHYLATACVSILKADRWGSVTWMELSSIPVLADLVSYLMAAECVSSASCLTSWAASSKTSTDIVGPGERCQDSSKSQGNCEETWNSHFRSPAPVADSSDYPQARVAFSPAFLRAVQTLPVPASFSEPLVCTRSVGRVEALPGVRLELCWSPFNLELNADIQSRESLRGLRCGTHEEPQGSPEEIGELRKAPRLLVALDSGMEHLVGESSNRLQIPEWQRMFVHRTMAGKDELQMEARVHGGEEGSSSGGISWLMISNLHAPTLGRSYACSSTALQCGSSSAACSITFAVHSTGGDRNSDITVSSGGAPLGRVLLGAVDGAYRREVLEGIWNGVSHASFVQLATRDLTSAFAPGLPGRQWAVHNQRTANTKALLAHLAEAGGTAKGGPTSRREMDFSSSSSEGLTLVLAAVGRHLLWFSEGQIIAAQMLPPSCTEVVPVVVISEAPEACTSPHVSAFWRNLVLTATLTFTCYQSICIPSNEAFYCLEPAPADTPVKLVLLASANKADAQGAVGACQSSCAVGDTPEARFGPLERTEDHGETHPLPGACGPPPVTDIAASGISSVGPPKWKFSALSVKVRSGISFRLPRGVPSVYTSPAWKWLRRPSSIHSSADEGLSEAQPYDSETDGNAARAVASTGHCSSDHSEFVASSDSRQVSGGAAFSDPDNAGGSSVFLGSPHSIPSNLPGTLAPTRAVLSPAPIIGQRGAARSISTVGGSTATSIRSSRHPGIFNDSPWVFQEAPPSIGSVHPALPFRVQFKWGTRTGGEVGTQVAGISWGCCRWLWFSNGRLVCPADLPLAELMRQHAEAPSSSPCGSSGMKGTAEEWREVHVTSGVTGFTARDVVEIEFQPAIPALFFKRNNAYQFGFHFDKFYQWTAGRTTRNPQPQQAAVDGDRVDTSNFPAQRFRSTELISAGSTVIGRSSTPPVFALAPRPVEIHQGAVEALFLAIQDRNLRWLSNFFAYYPDWLEEQDAAATPGSCTFASLEQRLLGGHNGSGFQRPSPQQQSHTNYFGDHENDTPLKLAIKKGHIEVVQLLIEEAGCNPDGVGDSSERVTPLMLASELGQNAIVAALVCKYGVNVNRRDADGNSALHRVVMCAMGQSAASARGLASPGSRPNYYSTIKLLLALGADCTLRNDVGHSPVELISSRGESVQEGQGPISRLLRHSAVTAEMQQAANTHSPLQAGQGFSPSTGACACLGSKWGALLANCSLIVGSSGDATPILHGLYIDGERRDEPHSDRKRTALSCCPPVEGTSEAEPGFFRPKTPLQQLQHHQHPSSPWHVDAHIGDWQMQTEAKKLLELKANSSHFNGNTEDTSAWASRSFTSLVASSWASAGHRRHQAAATASNADESAEGSTTACLRPSVPSNSYPIPPSVLRPGGCVPSVATADVRSLLQQLLVSGLDLYGDADPLPPSDGQPAPLRPPMPAASGALLRSVTWADDFQSLLEVFLTIIRRLIVLEEQQATQAPSQQQQQQQSASPRESRTVPAVVCKPDGWRVGPRKACHYPLSVASIRNSLQRLSICAESAESVEDILRLMLPLELIAGRIEGSTRRSWADSAHRQAWRHRVARHLGYQVALGGPGGIVWTPDVHRMAEATGCDVHQTTPRVPEEQTGKASGLLMVRTVVDPDDVVVQLALQIWPLKMDVWLRQILDIFEGPEDGRALSQGEKHSRIAALVWRADGDREEFLSFYRRCFLPVTKHGSLEDLEQAAALKDGIVSLIKEVSSVARPRSSIELLCEQIIGLRLRLLEHLNACAIRAIPVVSPIFNIPKLPLDYFGLLTAHSGPSFFLGTTSVTKTDASTKQHWQRSYSSSKVVLQVGPSDQPIEMSSYLFVRPLLTSATTNVLWKHIIDKLGYSSHEQPSLRLDRGQAATAKSLAHTLWYQATTQLLSASASPCRLRGRIGDRPFMVVFRGEGATDFGGPFQEFLSGVANEVMGPLAEAPDVFVPRFLACLPCLNSTHAIGPHQDSVILRPDPCGQPPDALISAASLQQPREVREDSIFEGGLLHSRYCSRTNPQVQRREAWASVSNSHECEEIRRISYANGSTSHQAGRLTLSHSQVERLQQVNTLWTPNTISSALPAPSRSIQQPTCHPEEARTSGRSQQGDPLGLSASRREEADASTPPVSPPSRPSGSDEEAPSEESMQLLMYEALGRLMAMCFCIGTAFNVTFNPLLWKKLVAAPLGIDDVSDSDCVAVEMIRSLRRMAAVPPQFWDSTMEASLSDMTFSTEDTLGRSFELVEGGADIPVNAFNLATFIRLSEKFRLLEDTEGVEAILRGIAAVIPLGRLRLLFDWRKLEYRVCGDREVDVAALKERTSCTSERLKAQLFEILESFSNEQMQRFLRFVCGRSRLPVASSDWRMTVDFETSEQRLPIANDNRLPTAATCSFRLLLPRYSSTEIMRQRLLYAISNCTAIDLDACVVHEQMQLMYD